MLVRGRGEREIVEPEVPARRRRGKRHPKELRRVHRRLVTVVVLQEVAPLVSIEHPIRRQRDDEIMPVETVAKIVAEAEPEGRRGKAKRNPNGAGPLGVEADSAERAGVERSAVPGPVAIEKPEGNPPAVGVTGARRVYAELASAACGHDLGKCEILWLGSLDGRISS